jgi:thiol-disulfide isomerase/thioredoxin
MDIYNKKKTPKKKPLKNKKTPKKKLLKKKKKTLKNKTPSPTVEEVIIEEPEPLKKWQRRKFRKFPKMRTRKVHFDEVVDSILLQKKEKPKHVQNKPLIFGRVYSEYCHFCRDMKGEWKKVCKNSVSPINDMGDPYEKKVQKFNTTYPNANLEVNGVPTIFRLMNEDSPVEYYSGPRTEPEMTKWIYG